MWEDVPTILRRCSLLPLNKDDCTSYRFVAFLKNKNDAIRFFLKVIRSIERTTGNRVLTLRTDRGKEFCNTEFDLLLEREGITRETSTSYTPQQNGYIERDNRTICEAARSMLHLYNLPLTLWAESIHTDVYILNRTINTLVGTITPYDLWCQTKPSVSRYRTFGTVAYISIDKSLRTKFQSKGHMVIFVGYSDSSKGRRFWHTSTNRITKSYDVIFDEATGYSSSSFASSQDSIICIPTYLLQHVHHPPIPTGPVSTSVSETVTPDLVAASDSTSVTPNSVGDLEYIDAVGEHHTNHTANDSDNTLAPSNDSPSSPPSEPIPTPICSNPSPLSDSSDPYDISDPSLFHTATDQPNLTTDEPLQLKF